MTDKALADALRGLLDRDMRKTCQHDNTHRGGFLWEICDECGAQWADDEGGKQEWADPHEWVTARAALAAYDADPGPDLSDPNTVYLNMLRGTIAKPTLEQIIHIYGIDALCKALAPQIFALRLFAAKLLSMADDAEKQMFAVIGGDATTSFDDNDDAP